MHILAAMIEMETALTAETAPERQLAGVREWCLEVARAVVAADVCGSSTGLTIRTEWAPNQPITHRLWLATCRAVIDALHAQAAHADALYRAALAEAGNAKTKRRRQAALERAQRAVAWKTAAAHAASLGTGLTAREDAILRPVGRAIAAAGGPAEVAKDKHYHQGGRR